jgi:hypothetical protein
MWRSIGANGRCEARTDRRDEILEAARCNSLPHPVEHHLAEAATALVDSDRDRDRRDGLRGLACERSFQRRIPARVGELRRAERDRDGVRLRDQAVVIVYEPELQIRVVLVLAIPEPVRDGIVVHELVPGVAELGAALEQFGSFGLGVELTCARGRDSLRGKTPPVPVKPGGR